MLILQSTLASKCANNLYWWTISFKTSCKVLLELGGAWFWIDKPPLKRVTTWNSLWTWGWLVKWEQLLWGCASGQNSWCRQHTSKVLHGGNSRRGQGEASGRGRNKVARWVQQGHTVGNIMTFTNTYPYPKGVFHVDQCLHKPKRGDQVVKSRRS